MATKWRQTSKMEHDIKKIFFSKCITVHSEQILSEKHRLKIKLRQGKRRLSQKIAEKRQEYGYMTSYVKNGTWYEEDVFSKYFSDHAKQLLPW